MWVSPFRYLRIDGYLLLPAAFRSLSRLSSALSAKASTLRSFLLDLKIISIALEMTGFCNLRLLGLFTNIVNRLVCYFSDVLIFNPHCLLFSCIQLNSVTLHFAVCIRPIRLHMNAILQASLQLSSLLFRQCSLFIKISFCMKFSRYKSLPLRESFMTETLSVIRNLSHLNSLITGKTSSIESALPCWSRLAFFECPFYLKPDVCITPVYFCFNLAATCFPIPSPV